MFAEKLDSLMNIAEVSNSLLGREVNMNPSYIGRLRSGARPLPKKHEYLAVMCRYLAGHIKKDYQLNALQKLTGIGSAALASADSAAQYMEKWLLEREQDVPAANGRLVSGGFRAASGAVPIPGNPEEPQKYAGYLYGNEGKRRAVEQFFAAVLQTEKPRTLLLFSDENMAWLYEDAAFAARWAELFKKVISKGNRVKIVHTVSRDLNEMLEAVIKWLPIYMSGMVEPYYYPRLRDGIFRRTLFIAPDTAAVVSSSIQQETGGMLNIFITDRTALNALTAEFGAYLSLCRPLMSIYTARDAEIYSKAAENLVEAEGNAYLICEAPPVFTMPEALVRELAEQSGNECLFSRWEKSFSVFREIIEVQHLTLVLPDVPDLPDGAPFSACGFACTKEQCAAHMERMRRMERKYENLKIRFVRETADNMRISRNTRIYIKENSGVIVAQTTSPGTAFVISEKNMVSAFWDYTGKLLFP